MARGIRVPFVADVRDWLRGIGRMADSLDDAERHLDNLGDDADRAGEDVEQAFERAGREAEKAFRDMARDADRQFERIETDAEQTGREVADAMARSSRQSRLAEVGSELGEELAENVGEGFRSGNPADVVFETLTSLAPALGGLGFAIGGIAGLVGGIIRGANEASAEAQAKIGELAASWFDVASESYTQGKEAARALREGFIAGAQADEQLATTLGVDTVQEAWAEVARLVEESKLPIDVVTQATLGNKDALDQVNAALATNDAEYQAVLDRADAVTDSNAEALQYIEDQQGPLDTTKQALEEIAGYSADSAEALDRAAAAAEAEASYTQAMIGPQATVAADAERAASGLSGAAYNAQLLRDRLARVSTPSFQLVQDQLGYAAANAWSLANALGTVNDEADLKGISRGALMR